MSSQNNETLSIVISISYFQFLWKHAFNLQRPTNMDTSAKQIHLGRNHIIFISRKMSTEVSETIAKKGPQSL